MNNRKSLFDNYITKHLSHFRNPYQDRRYKKNYLTHNYRKFFPQSRDARILDLGPGYGELLEILIKEFSYMNVQAIDISQEVVDYCNAVIPNSTLLVDNTIEFLSTYPQKFDTVFMMQVLEHIPKNEIIPLLCSVHRSLAQEGRLVLEVPNMANPLIGLYVRYADFTHEVGFTEMSLRYVLESSQFEQIEMFNSRLPMNHYARPFQVVNQKIIRLLLKILYKSYALEYPKVLSPNLCVTAIAKQ